VTRPSSPILPLASRDDVLAELADTERRIDRLGAASPVIAPERREEALATLNRWRTRLRDQLTEMENQ
jgi:hypothetical protein